MNQSFSFRTVRRGYDPQEVDEVINRIKQEQNGAYENEIAQLRDALNESQASQASLQQRLTAAEEQAAGNPPQYADLGPRIAQILTLAEEQAAEIRQAAREDADATANETQAWVEKQREQTEWFVSDSRSKAEAEAARIIESANQRAADIADHAEREASARRSEAAAVYEQQQAAAASAAADFEKTLAMRREEATVKFQSQMENQERALQSVLERKAAAEAEADRVLEDAKAQAQNERERASQEARQAVEQARAQAERLQRESERELAALVTRRDSINEQLSNVRQMLASFGGGGALGAALNDLANEAEQGAPVPDAEATTNNPVRTKNK